MRTTTFPVLENANLTLRPLILDDLAQWYGYLSIPHVLEQTSWQLNSFEDLQRAFDSYNFEDAASSARFAIMERKTQVLVGTVGFHTISQMHRSAEIAYDFHPDYWGRGLATECCKSAADWAIRECGYVRVQATTLDSNTASARVLQKCGFELEGKLRNFRMVRGTPRDFWLYSVLGH